MSYRIFAGKITLDSRLNHEFLQDRTDVDYPESRAALPGYKKNKLERLGTVSQTDTYVSAESLFYQMCLCICHFLHCATHFHQ